MNIGNAIKLCRNQKGINQAQLANDAGISVSYLSLIERNERDPSLSTLKNIAGALRIPLSILIFLSADENDLGGLSSEIAEKISWVTYKLMSQQHNGQTSL